MTPEAAPLRPATPPAFVAALVVLVLAALVPTLWTSVDLGAAALFSGPQGNHEAVHWPWVVWINAWIPAAFRVVLLLALLAWALTFLFRKYQGWRFALLFVVLAGALGPGAVVNMVFKDHWQRARPYQVTVFGGGQQFTRAGVITDQCDNNCSFVSGHVACGFFVISLALLQRRRQYLWTGLGLGAGLLIGFARMADSAHWLSDVLWAGPITLVCSWLVWRAMGWQKRRHARA